MKDDSDRYLDPQHNPMLPGGSESPHRSDVEDPFLSWDRNPMIPRSETDYGRECFDFSPDEIQARLSLRYPGAYEIALGPHKLTRMADGSFSLNDAPMAEAPGSVLAELSALLTER